MPMREHIAMRCDLRMSSGSEDAEIMVYGSIVSHKWDDSERNTDVTAKEFDKLLKEAKSGGAKRLTLRINSGGGAVFQAVAMRAMLLSAGFDSVDVRIEGMCASAATLLACVPGSRVSIAEGAMYMIHNPSSIVWGDAAAMEHEAELLHKMERDVRGIYNQRCGMDDSELKSLMDAETWYTAQEAIDAGFADEIIDGAGLEAASVDTNMIAAMRDMYKHVPEQIGCAETRENPDNTGRNEEPAVAAGESAVNRNHDEEENHMEIKDVTIDQLRAENPALHMQIMQAGAQQERERIQEIDDMTPIGYEEMAATAKKNGTSATDFCKQVVKAQKQKGKDFMASRQQETAPAAQVAGGSAEMNDGKTEQQELDSFAKEMKAIADGMGQNGINATMY